MNVHTVSGSLALIALVLCGMQYFKSANRLWHPIRGTLITVLTVFVVGLNFYYTGPAWGNPWFLLHSIFGGIFFGYLLLVQVPTGLSALYAGRSVSVDHRIYAPVVLYSLVVSLFFACISSFIPSP